MKNFTGKTAFITGGASGAGLGQAQIFSEAGMKVVIADLRQDRLDEAASYFKEKNAPIHAIRLDVTDREAYAEAADEVERVFGGPPHLLVNTAGVNVFGPAEASSYDDYDWVMGVCLGGVVNGLVTFVPRMIRAYARKEEAHIAATVSWGAFGAGPVTAPYAAAKAAVLNLMESYRISLKSYGIGVSTICPANIRSHIYETALHRPENLRNTGYNVTEKTQQFLASIHEHGMDPRVLAERLKEGIENDLFLVIPYKDGPRMVEIELERFKYLAYPGGEAELAARRDTPARRAELLRMKNEREGYDVAAAGPIAPPPAQEKNAPPRKLDTGGFAMANKDADWVDPDKKAQG